MNAIVVHPQSRYPGAKLLDKVYSFDGKIGVVIEVSRKRWWEFWKTRMLTIEVLGR